MGKNDRQTESSGTRRKRYDIATVRKEQGPSGLPGVRLLLLLLESKMWRQRWERAKQGERARRGVRARVSSLVGLLGMS